MLELFPPLVAQHENAVAGAILIDPHCLPDITAHVSPTDFYYSEPKAVFEAAMSLDFEGETVDPYTILDRAMKRGTTLSEKYITEAMYRTPTAQNAEAYARLVKEHSRCRGLYAMAQEVIARLEDNDDTADIENGMSAALEALAVSGSNDVVIPSLAAMTDWYNHRMDGDANGVVAAVRTGYSWLDRTLGGGMINGGLYVLGGRPGMGKSTMGLCIADKIASRQSPVLFVSLEMSRNEISAKRIARKAGIPYHRALIGPLEEKDKLIAGEGASALSDIPLFLTDRPTMTVYDILAAARRVKGLSAVVIDYLNLIKPAEKSNSRYENMTGVSNDLKRLARTLKIPVLCLAQLNRQVETRGGKDTAKRPQLSDLRETGAIEQDADAVIFLYRDAYYSDEDNNGAIPQGESLDVIVAKNRHGNTGTVKMTWYGATGRIYEDR